MINNNYFFKNQAELRPYLQKITKNYVEIMRNYVSDYFKHLGPTH